MFKLMCRRIFLSRYFAFGLICAVSAHLLNLSAVIKYIFQGESDAVYYLDYSLGFGSFYSLFALAPAIACGLIFKAGSVVHPHCSVIIKDSRRSYFVSQAVTCMLAGGSVIMLSAWISLGFMRIWIPFVEIDRLEYLRNDFHAYLWVNGSPFNYIAFYSFLFMLYGGLAALVALTVSAFTKNMFNALVSPLFVFHSLEILYSLLDAPNALKPSRLLAGYFILGDNLLAEAVKILGIYLLYMAPLIILYARRIRRMNYE